MQTREIIPIKQPLDLKLKLPGSKSITNRAILCAALANGESRVFGILKSDDSEVMLRSLKQLGIIIEEKSDHVVINGKGGKMDTSDLELDLHNAGTATRFLTALMVVRNGETIVTGNKRMQERPISDLVDGLRQIGADIKYFVNEGFPPLKITNSKLRVNNTDEYLIKMKGNKSSQYFSALLMLGPLLGKVLKIEVEGDLVSKPYIDTTISVMKAFGVSVVNNDYSSFEVSPQDYMATDYVVEGDASSASYFSSLHFLHEGYLEFENLDYLNSIQGDINFPKMLGTLGMGSINMESMPDSAMTLAVLAPFQNGDTKITGLSTLKIKETDRLHALKTELGKIGFGVSTTDDSIFIEGADHDRQIRKGAHIATYNDHRMAMCFAVLGTKVPGIIIEDPGCTDKTYPNFWEDLELAYLSPIKLGEKNLVLTGMRAVGKTYYGKMISKLLNREFIDLDYEIENSEGFTIPEIVEKYGWGYFREIEQKMCSKYSDKKNLVISTGGGVVLDPRNMLSLKKNGVNVFIFADPQILFERRKSSHARPPIHSDHNTMSEINKVWEERHNLYLRYADFVWDDTSGKIVRERLSEIFV